MNSDAELAFDWLEERLRQNDLHPDYWPERVPHSLKAAVSVLTQDQRLKLLTLAFSDSPENQNQEAEKIREAKPNQGLKGLTKALVNRDVDLYQKLLKNQPRDEKLLSRVEEESRRERRERDLKGWSI